MLRQVAYDLVSNTSQKPRAPQPTDPKDNHYQHKLNPDQLDKLGGGQAQRGDGAERSVKSEFDYNSKKNFTDMLKEPSKQQMLARLHQNDGMK